jgi:hypothetical protein
MDELMIDLIVADESLSVPEKEDRVAEALRGLPGHGADEAARTIAEGDSLAVTFAAACLAVLPNHMEVKRRSVEHVLRHRPDLLDDVSRLVRFVDRNTADQIVRRCLDDPEAHENALAEAAEAFPDMLRAHRDKIEGAPVEAAVWPGAPKDWLDSALKDWRGTYDVAVLEKISFIRTDEARRALLGLRDAVPSDDLDLYEVLVENAGVFPETGEPSVYPRTLMGLVGDRDTSPHHMGPGYGPTVPVCPTCECPAVRVLTLARGALPFEVQAAAEPSFFWFPCDCEALEYLHAHVTPDGVQGVMTEVGPPDDDEDWLPGRLALELDEHPNQFGMATDAIPGFSAHQAGGYPPWAEADRFPHCGVCGRSTRFLASVDSGLTAFGRMPFNGILYGFWCEDCSVSVTFEQRLI